MARYKMVMYTKPVNGREADYNEWYQNVHLPQVTAFAGFKSAQRFKLAIPLGGEPLPYLAIYDIETDDINAVLQEMASQAGTARLVQSDAQEGAAVQGAIWEEFGPSVYHTD